jgi:beta-galactosidase
MKTANAPAKLDLKPDRSEIRADGRDLSFITLSVTDKNGVRAPRADNRIRFELDGPGEIVATDNGDPTSFESFQSHDRNAFNGLCLVIVRGQRGVAGKITITATGEGLKAGKTLIQSASGS